MKIKELFQKEKKAISLNIENKDLFNRRINPTQNLHKNYNILINNKINNNHDNFSQRDFIVNNMNNRRKINKPQNLEINNNTFRNDKTNLNNHAYNEIKVDYINNIHDRVITDVTNYESNTTDINKNKKFNKLNKNVIIRNFKKNYTHKNIIISNGKEVVIKNNNTALNDNLEENNRNQIYDIKANLRKILYKYNTSQNI